VVHGQAQRVLGVSQSEQGGSQHQNRGEVEWASSLLLEATLQLRRTLRLRPGRQIDHLHVHGSAVGDDLHRRAIDRHVRRTQRTSWRATMASSVRRRAST